MPRVLCTSLNTETGPHIPVLEAAGFEVVHPPRDLNLYETENLYRVVQNCEAVVTGSEPYPAHLLERLPKLRVLSRTGVGFDAIDVPTCDRLGIVVATTPGVNHHAVAEHTFSFIFGLGRDFPARDQEVRLGQWTRRETPRIMGSTLGILGLGRIGRAVATRARGLGMRVVAFDPYPPLEFAEQWNVELVELEDLLQQSDYVSLHLPVGPDTKQIMNARTFALMKPRSVFINTARGGLVDEEALIASLQAGHLRGAGLDVFQIEPLPSSSPLLTMPNVMLSGHVAGLDCESQRDTLIMSANTIVGLLNGDWPTACVRNLAGVKGWAWMR